MRSMPPHTAELSYVVFQFPFHYYIQVEVY